MERGNAKRSLSDLKRCFNPSAYECLTCRYHGATPAHTRKNATGENHPQFKHGRCTKKSKELNRQAIIKLRQLEDLGHLIGLFARNITRTRGRKPNGYQNWYDAENNQS